MGNNPLGLSLEASELCSGAIPNDGQFKLVEWALHGSSDVSRRKIQLTTK